MVADEELVVRRDRGAERLDRCLVIRRPVGQPDQLLLAGKRLERGFLARAVGQLRAHPARLFCRARRPRGERSAAKSGQDLPAVHKRPP